MDTNTTATNDGNTVDQNSAFIPCAEKKLLSSETVKNMTLAEAKRTYAYTTAIHVVRHRERPWAFCDGPRMLVANIACALQCHLKTANPMDPVGALLKEFNYHVANERLHFVSELLPSQAYHLSDEVGWETEIEASSLEEATGIAQKWVLARKWTGDYACIDVAVCPIIKLPHSIRVEHPEAGRGCKVIVAETEPVPECPGQEGHFWFTPREIVKGDSENPGMIVVEWLRVKTKEVCEHCGKYRVSVTDLNPGQPWTYPTCTRYYPADEASLKYLGQ